MELNNLRLQINEIDDNLLKLLKKRFEICKEIGKLKTVNDLPITNLERERQIIQDKIKKFSLPEGFVKNFFGSIFEESKRLQLK